MLFCDAAPPVRFDFQIFVTCSESCLKRCGFKFSETENGRSLAFSSLDDLWIVVKRRPIESVIQLDAMETQIISSSLELFPGRAGK